MIMETNNDDSAFDGPTINFALRIQLTKTAKGNNYEIKSMNQGIPDSEIILMVENWVEQVKKKYKAQLGGMNFLGKEK